MEQESLPPDFKDFFKLLNDEKVEYMLIGGWAVGIYGAGRYTQDIDVWVAVSIEKRDADHESLAKIWVHTWRGQ